MIKIDKLIYSNRRSIQIQISAVGELIVRAPKRSSESAIMRFVMQKQEWIEKHQSKIKQKVQSNCDIITNDSVLFFGKSYKISQTATKTISFDNNDSLCLIPQKVQNLSSYIKKKYQKMGMKYFHDRVEHWGKVMHNLPQVLRLTNAKTCWGTCNSKRVVSLNWRLLMVGADESDYAGAV